MARTRKELKTNSLKKLNNTRYKDTKTGLEYSKRKRNQYNMVVSKDAQKQHQRNVKKLQRLNKKYGGAFNKELQVENENWNAYKKAINQFNKGQKVRPTTVKKELNYFQKSNEKQAKLISNQKTISSIVDDKKKVTIMRMSGKHGIYNGKAYDDYVKSVADDLNISPKQAEEQMFPNIENDKIDYEDYKNFITGNGKMKTIFDTINEKEKSGEISEQQAIEIENRVMIGNE